MSRIIASSDVVSFLAKLKEATEIQNSEGKTLGVFTPGQVADQGDSGDLFDLAEAEETLSKQYNLGRPLPEIWRDLHSKGASG